MEIAKSLTLWSACSRGRLERFLDKLPGLLVLAEILGRVLFVCKALR